MTPPSPTGNSSHRFRALGIRSQLLIAFGGVFAILLTIYLFANRTFDHDIDISKQLATDHLDSITAARDMRDAIDQIGEVASLSRREGMPLDDARINAAADAFDQAMALQKSSVSLPGEEGLTRDIQDAWQNIRNSVSDVRGDSELMRSVIIQDRLAPLIREVRPMITRLSQMNAQGIKLRNSEIQQEAVATHRMLHLDLLLGLVAAIGFALLMARRIVRPLAGLTASAKAIAQGNLDQDLPVKSRDELGQLAATFNQMIGELKRFRALDADRLLRASQTAQTAIDSLPDGVVMVEENRKVELANETAKRLFGIAAGQTDLQRRLPWFESALQRSDELPDGYKNSIHVDDNGVNRSFLPRSVALQNGDGRAIGWTLILVDVTAFQRLDQFKDSLLSMASHELKTPLTSMRMILPLLLEQSIGTLNAKQAELLAVTRDAMERMRQIVETILDLGRLASGKMPTDLKAVPPVDLPAKCVEAMRPAFAAKDVDLRVEIAEGLPAVHCDSNHMYHVFSNLLSNALRHTPAGGNVVISAELRAAMRFEVKDNGCGIAPAHLPQLFETFYRVPGQRSDTGTGLGLSLVKQIVEAHGGNVGVESISSQGSTFWFTVPLAPAPASTDKNRNGDESEIQQPITDDAVLAAR